MVAIAPRAEPWHRQPAIWRGEAFPTGPTFPSETSRVPLDLGTLIRKGFLPHPTLIFLPQPISTLKQPNASSTPLELYSVKQHPIPLDDRPLFSQPGRERLPLVLSELLQHRFAVSSLKTKQQSHADAEGFASSFLTFSPLPHLPS